MKEYKSLNKCFLILIETILGFTAFQDAVIGGMILREL